MQTKDCLLYLIRMAMRIMIKLRIRNESRYETVNEKPPSL